MKTYRGDRTIDGLVVTVDDAELGDATDIHVFSRAGFEWSYEGPGPSQLALAILLDHFGDAGKAMAAQDRFMRAAVANFDNEWVMTSEDIDHVLAVA